MGSSCLKSCFAHFGDFCETKGLGFLGVELKLKHGQLSFPKRKVETEVT